MQKILLKKELNNFISGLMKQYQVIAPVKTGNTKFKIVENLKDLNNLYLEKITQVSVKKFFLPENEILVSFKNGKMNEGQDKIKERVIFGLRKCDLNGLLILDMAMKHPSYFNKRKKTILIGIYCENPDKFCFCNSMRLEDCYDLFFYPKGKEYYISVGSEKGKKLVQNLINAKKEYTPKIKNTKLLNNKDIGKEYRNKNWKKDADKCLSCGACTAYCPTCNCFDIRDEVEVNLRDGKRVMRESSCQLKSFSRVAGGKVFRESRLARFKHFVYHKIVYFKNQCNRYMCVGCGRCLRVCPTNIDWVNTINKIKEEK